MARTNFKSVDEYIAAQPKTVQPILKLVRKTIRQALPRAQEVISYKIAAYKLPQGVALYFAGWKQHYSLYPATGRAATELKDEVAGYKVSKGTIRFRLSEPVPVEVDSADREAARKRPDRAQKGNNRLEEPSVTIAVTSTCALGSSVRPQWPDTRSDPCSARAARLAE
jgi:uncharacterized protein YdhG (YjbR/CyaY superfamily)